MSGWIKHPGFLLCLVVTGLLLPFMDRPAHIDDGLYLMLADQIGWNPLEFHNQDFQFLGQTFKDYNIFEATHPPLMSYYLKIVGTVNPNRSMRIYHLFFLPFAWMTAVGFFFMRDSRFARPTTTDRPCWPPYSC